MPTPAYYYLGTIRPFGGDTVPFTIVTALDGTVTAIYLDGYPSITTNFANLAIGANYSDTSSTTLSLIGSQTMATIFSTNAFDLYNISPALACGNTGSNSAVGNAGHIYVSPGNYADTTSTPLGSVSFGPQQTITQNPSSNTCFVKGTPIDSDQGPIAIDLLDPNVHTINSMKIVAISKTVSSESYLIQLEKDALNLNEPNQLTTISQCHAVLHNGKMTLAKNLPNAKRIKYDGQILYNVLLENYSRMTVNNLTVETLNPRHHIAILYRHITTNNLSQDEQNKLIDYINKKTDLINILRKSFFSNICLIIMLDILTENKEPVKEVNPITLLNAFCPNPLIKQ